MLKVSRFIVAVLLTLVSLHSLAATQAIRPYQALYESKWKLGWFTLTVKGERTLSKLQDNQWKLTFNASATGAGLKETSLFRFTDGQIKPERYTYRTSGFLNKDDQTIRFDHPNKTLFDEENERTYVWQDRLFDPVSYMEQARFELGQRPKELRYIIYRDGKPRDLLFTNEGRFWLNTPLGRIKAVKLRLIEGSRTTDAWFAEDHDYLMVRIRELHKGEQTYDIRLKEVTFND